MLIWIERAMKMTYEMNGVSQISGMEPVFDECPGPAGDAGSAGGAGGNPQRESYAANFEWQRTIEKADASAAVALSSAVGLSLD